MHNILRNTDLLQILLAGIRMVAVNYDGRIYKIIVLLIGMHYIYKILIMIVGMITSELIDITPHDGMGVWITRRIHFPSTIDEGMRILSRDNGIHHD